MRFSVLICTRNRAQSLEATLRKFFAQRFSAEYDFELVVVDNNSSDQTRTVVERWAAERPEAVRYVYEPTPGLCFARNTAVAAARGEIVVFTDDDVLAEENWLNEIHREFAQDPELYVMGGRVLIAREGLQKVALLQTDERLTYRYPDSGGGVIGANMAFKREVFDRIGGFDVRLGPGRFLSGADETEFLFRALKAGYKILYAPNALVYHDHNRTTVEQACNLEYGYGKGCSAYILKHAFMGDRYAARMFYWLVRQLPGRWLKKSGESDDALLRRRAQIRGIIVGLIAAPVVMSAKRQETPGGQAKNYE